MILNISLHNFKCFTDIELPVAPLTLLTGLNGMGKSSVIQSLLLLRQSYLQGFLSPSFVRRREHTGGLLLNGELISLGTANDVYCEFAGDEEIHISLNQGILSRRETNVVRRLRENKWRFCYQDPNTNLLDLILESIQVAEEDIRRYMEQIGGIDEKRAVRFVEERTRSIEGRRLQEQSLFNDNFQYLQAERFGPRVSFATSDYQVRQKRQLGSHGEFAVHYLAVFGDAEKEDVVPEMRHPNAVSPRLRPQVEAWLSEISPGARLEITPNYGTDSVSVRFGYVEGSSSSRPYRATNVGFGLSYLLPVLVALLAAKRGSLLLLENPEAHLHPRGQSKMGRLMALAAKAGVQILVETHSDHILNGVRLAVHDQEIAPELVQLHFFGRGEDAETKFPRAIVKSPKIDENGRISEWPEGFFDEWDNSLSRLVLPHGFSFD